MALTLHRHGRALDVERGVVTAERARTNAEARLRAELRRAIRTFLRDTPR